MRGALRHFFATLFIKKRMDYQEPPQDAISRKGYLLKDLCIHFPLKISHNNIIILHFAMVFLIYYLLYCQKLAQLFSAHFS